MLSESEVRALLEREKKTMALARDAAPDDTELAAWGDAVLWTLRTVLEIPAEREGRNDE